MFNDLVMKIVWSLFVHNFMNFVNNLSCIENIYCTCINVMINKVWTYEWMNFASSLLNRLTTTPTKKTIVVCLMLKKCQHVSKDLLQQLF